MGEEIPIVYLWLYKKFLDKNCSHIRTRDAEIIIKHCIYRLKVTWCCQILKDMERYGLIKRINRNYFQILLDHEKEVKRLIDIPFLVF